MFSFSRENTGLIAKWWRNIDKQILLLFIFLLFLGLFFSFSSTSPVVGEKMNKQTYFFFIKHFVFVCISLSLLFAISIQESNKLIKILNSGESFGEIALLRGRKRHNSAVAIEPTTLKIIKGSMISQLINAEDPMVQLVLLSLAKKLEIINGIRSIDHHNRLRKEGLII